MDRIFVSALSVQAIIGVYDRERINRQTLNIDLEITMDVAEATQSEDVRHTVNYRTLTTHLNEFVAANDFMLIETLAERVAEVVLSDYKVPWVKVTVHKPEALDNCADVGIIIERGTRPD